MPLAPYRTKKRPPDEGGRYGSYKMTKLRLNSRLQFGGNAVEIFDQI